MTAQRMSLLVIVGAMIGACSRESTEPNAGLAPSFANAGAQRNTIVVNPNAKGNGIAVTIQEGVDRVAPGGTVLVKPGVYAEALLIDKGLTLEGIADGGGNVVIAPPGTPTIAVQIATREPVTIRDVTLRFSGANGIRGLGVVDLTVERATVLAINPPLGVGTIISVVNDPNAGGRARLVVRESFLDGGVAFANSPTPPFAQMFPVLARGDLDALIAGNVVRRAGGACLFMQMRNDFGGSLTADILNNDLDECYPLGRAASILVAPPGGAPILQTVTATGEVNIIGNKIRNSTSSCLPTTAIHYEFYTGRIENNSITSVVQPCAITTPTGARVPSAILVGSFRVGSGVGAPAATPVIRFNDIAGNAQAGVRLATSATANIDARCNWWGASTGPAGAGSGTGDAVVMSSGAGAVQFTPFATAPIAGTGATSCE